MKKDCYWWIADAKGLIQFGREISTEYGITESGAPNLCYTRKEAANFCMDKHEKPVKVKIVKL
jgi:hypothetical protein